MATPTRYEIITQDNMPPKKRSKISENKIPFHKAKYINR